MNIIMINCTFVSFVKHKSGFHPCRRSRIIGAESAVIKYWRCIDNVKEDRMKVIVGYVSQTGNTKKIAEAIIGEIQAEKDIRQLGEIDGLEGYDLAFVGFPIHGSFPAKDAEEFLEKHSAGKNVALFITHAAPEDREELPHWLDNCRAPAAGASLLGVFNCQGELAKEVADFMLKSGDSQLIAYAKERPLTVGQPDASRLERARVFAREVMQKYSASR
jgi:flavodoxin